MGNLKDKQQFIRFLKDNNVYGNYMHAFENRELYRKRISTLKTFFIYYTPEQYLLCAFDWGNTKEGWQYWRNLYDKWMHYLDSINNNYGNSKTTFYTFSERQ